MNVYLNKFMVYFKLQLHSSDAYADAKQVSNLGIIAYPYLVILKNGETRYSGRLEIDRTIIVNNLENELEKLLDE